MSDDLLYAILSWVCMHPFLSIGGLFAVSYFSLAMSERSRRLYP